jgi:hypothetical protein
MSLYHNIFSQEDIDYINILPEVIDAKNKLTSNNSKHTFYISLTDSIRTSLSILGLDLTNVTQIPMRWISGDTAEHIDHGKSQFNNTYLVFINNSPGSFVLENTTYPIVENTAFVFNEGIVHKTQDTQGLRLLVGPMNEFAEPVGAPPGITYYANESDALSYTNNIAGVYSSFILGNTDYGSLAGYPGTNNGWKVASNSFGLSTGVHPNGFTLDNSNGFSYYHVFPYTLNGIPCFVGNTRVLTNNGYKQIDKLHKNDLIITSDNKTQAIRLYTTKVYSATTEDAPYIIEPSAFGENKPSAPVYLSPEHKIYLGNNIWTTSAVESKTNPLVKQYGIGEEIIYYHIECANYFTDNLVTEDLIVESFGTHKSTGTTDAVWYKTVDGYIRKNN